MIRSRSEPIISKSESDMNISNNNALRTKFLRFKYINKLFHKGKKNTNVTITIHDKKKNIDCIDDVVYIQNKEYKIKRSYPIDIPISK